MSRADIFTGIFAELTGTSALYTLLGPASSANLRVYRAFPQQEPLLTGYEPAEGWLVLEEPPPGFRAAMVQFDTAQVLSEFIFHLFVTQMTLADQVCDFLDAEWHWHTIQQHATQYGDYILVYSRRFQTMELYDAQRKLYHKLHQYRMRFMQETLPV